MGKKCYNGGNKHNFEPRYDEVPTPESMKFDEISFVSYPQEYRKLFVRKVYIKDICKWCGKDTKK